MYDDSYLIGRIKEGNYVAYNLLIKRYNKYVWSILYQILKNREEVEEAYQDTFMKVYRSLEQYNDQSKFSSWLYKIAYNTGLDYAKKRKIRTIDIDNAYAVGEEAKVIDVMERNSVRKQLEMYLEKIPADEATILKLFYFQEMSVKEVAEILEMTETNVKTKLFRSRKKLAELIAKNNDELLISYNDGRA